MRSPSSSRGASHGNQDRPDSVGSTKAASKLRTYVKHDYHDHFFDPVFQPMAGTELGPAEVNRRGPRGGVVTPFPEKLYKMLQEADKVGFEDVVSWQPHGRCFVVHQPKRFVAEILPK